MCVCGEHVCVMWLCYIYVCYVCVMYGVYLCVGMCYVCVLCMHAYACVYCVYMCVGMCCICVCFMGKRCGSVADFLCSMCQDLNTLLNLICNPGRVSNHNNPFASSS